MFDRPEPLNPSQTRESRSHATGLVEHRLRVRRRERQDFLGTRAKLAHRGTMIAGEAARTAIQSG